MLIYILIAFGVAAVFLGLSSLFFDAILRRQYDAYSDAWVRGGRLQGHWFRPDGIGFSDEGLADLLTSRVEELKMIFKTPEWLQLDASTRRFLCCFRIASVIGFLGLAGSISMFAAV